MYVYSSETASGMLRLAWALPLEIRGQPIQALPCVQDLRCITLHTFGFNRFTDMLLSPLSFDAR